jgi:hypothetical protein
LISAGDFAADAMVVARPVSSNSASVGREFRGRTAGADNREAQKSAGRLKRRNSFVFFVLPVISWIVLPMLLLFTRFFYNLLDVNIGRIKCTGRLELVRDDRKKKISTFVTRTDTKQWPTNGESRIQLGSATAAVGVL